MGFLQEDSKIYVGKDKEKALRSKMKAEAMKECLEYKFKYDECGVGRTMSVVWKCRKQAKELNACLDQHTNDSALEKMMLQEKQKGL